MSVPAPIVYILHGEDEFGMAQFVDGMQEKLGDPTTAELNVTRLDGKKFDYDELKNSASVLPFLSSRRMVVMDNASKKITRKEGQEKFLALLEDLPQSTALVLMEKRTLTPKNWLLKWAKGAGERVYMRAYRNLSGPEMAKWISHYAKEQGGSFEPQAAALLAEMVAEEPRIAANEVVKLLAYVNYSRPVDVNDVDLLAAFAGRQGDFFKLIDGIASGNGRLAMDMLQLLLDERDALPLFFSLVGHFRLLLQTREIFEKGGLEGTAASELGIHPFRAKKLFAQAKPIPLMTLETIYRKLLDYDLQIKTGKISGDLALETLVVVLTS